MSSSPSIKDLCTISETKNKIKEEDEIEQEEDENPSHITTHLYLKRGHTNETLDKNVVLRRIRKHRNRVNKAKSVVRGLFSSPFASSTNKTPNPQIKWADDAFGAL